MDPGARSGLDALLPFAVGACMAVGSFVGYSIASPTLLQEGPSGDMAGAAGALTMIFTGAAGFFASGVATVVARARQRGVPERFIFRLGLSLAAGGALGAIVTAESELAGYLFWVLLLGAPAAIAWFWRTALPPLQLPGNSGGQPGV